MDITICPHCATRVVPKPNDTCPSCHRAIGEDTGEDIPEPEPATWPPPSLQASATKRFARSVLGFACVLSGAICLILAFTAFINKKHALNILDSISDSLDFVSSSLLFVFVGGGLLLVGRRFFAAARRPPEGTPEIVFLRSFLDDEVSLSLKPTWRMNFRELIRKFFGDDTLEQVVARVSRRFGRIETIGAPGERLPKLGARRKYFSTDDDQAWRAQVIRYLGGCRAVIAVLGSTEGLVWEYRQLLSLGLGRRLILIVPPAPDPLRRWTIFRNVAITRMVEGLPESLPPDVVIVRFDEAWRPRIYPWFRGMADSYSLRLGQAISDLWRGKDTLRDRNGASPSPDLQELRDRGCCCWRTHRCDLGLCHDLRE